jgi:cell division protein FtsW
MTRRPVRRYSPRSHSRDSASDPRAFAANALDGGVVAAISILAGMGLVMVYSLTAPLASASVLPPQFTRQLVALAVGGLALVVALHVPLVLWRRLAMPLWGLCVVLLIATWLGGVEVNGARRWLEFPGGRLQPAEFTKFATLLAVAVQLTSKSSRGARLRPVVAASLLCLPPVTLLLFQPDFGSSMVLCASVGVLLFAGGVSLRLLALPTILMIGGASIYVALRPYAHLRWTGFLDPWATAGREGFQLVQSFVAFGRGGIFGVGIGDGRQKLYFLPEAHTDFILAGVAEELGLIGVLIVLGAFTAYVWGGTRIAGRAKDPFAALLALGMTTIIGVPAAINAAVVMGLLPTTGFTLPFVSFGGNSLVVCLLAAGILLRIGACEAPLRHTRISGASRRRVVQT